MNKRPHGKGCGLIFFFGEIATGQGPTAQIGGGSGGGRGGPNTKAV